MNVLMRVGAPDLIESLAPAIHNLASRLNGRLAVSGDHDYDALRPEQ